MGVGGCVRRLDDSSDLENIANFAVVLLMLVD